MADEDGNINNIDVNINLNNDGDDDDNDNNDNNNLIDIDDEDDDDLNDSDTHIDGGVAVDGHGGSGVTVRRSSADCDLVRRVWYIFYVDDARYCRQPKFFSCVDCFSNATDSLTRCTSLLLGSFYLL